jgi:S-adenosylmethionine decarboxylase proenzyme
MKHPEALGWHWLIDFHHCKNMPHEPEVLERILVEAAELAGATVVQSCFHRFSPHGLSGVVVIAESHLAAHTWPEHNAICVDLFSCSQRIEVQVAIDFIASKVLPSETEVQYLVRGKQK